MNLKKQLYYLFPIIFILFECNTPNITSNKDQINDSISCNKLMEFVSYFWKNDSLANNGYRYIVIDRFKKCKNQGISKNEVLNYLGSPDKLFYRSDSTFHVRYLYYNSKYIDYNKSYAPNVLGNNYIEFQFNNNNNLTDIYFGSIDY